MRLYLSIIVSFITIAFIIYSPVFPGEFVIDDYGLIVQNTIVHSISNLPIFLTGSTFFNGDMHKMFGGFYRPVNTTYYSLLYTFFGPQPFYFHIVQIFIHAINAFLLFLVFRIFFTSINKTNNHLIAFLMALIFLVHPMQVGGVAYIAASQDPLFFMFGLTALLLTIRYGYRLYIAPILFFIMLTKEAGVLFIALLFTYLYLFDKKYLKKYILSVCVIIGSYIFLRCNVAHLCSGAAADHTPLAHVAINGYLMQVPKIMFFYLKTFFYPRHLLISQHWYVKEITLSDFYLPLIFDIAAVVILLFFLFKIYYQESLNKHTPRFKKQYIFSFFLLWFTFGLGLHMHLLPLDFTVSDQWFYFPMAGLLGVFGVLISYYIPRSKRKLVIISILTVSILFSVRTYYRSGNWRTQYGLLMHDYQESAPSFDLENNIGYELFNRNKLAEAQTHFKQATILAPDWPIGWDNLGVTYELQGKLDEAEVTYKNAITEVPYYSAYEHYTAILIKRKKWKEADSFLKNKALPTFPHNLNLQKLKKQIPSSY